MSERETASLQASRREPTIERLTELCSAMEKYGPRDWALQMRQILDLHSAPEVSTVEEHTFEQAWALKEKEGYRYGPAALEQVRFGWEMAHAANGKETSRT